MNFINQVKTPIHRTIYKTDVELFQMMLNEQKSNLKYYIDNRQLVMVAIGILNRTFNLEDYLVAVVGQNWRFRKGVKVGETISVDYQICENNTLTKKVVSMIFISRFLQMIIQWQKESGRLC